MTGDTAAVTGYGEQDEQFLATIFEQRKTPFKQYVPNLLDEDTYDAKQLADTHPIRYANTAAIFDINEDRHHENLLGSPAPQSWERTSGFHFSWNPRKCRLVARTYQRRRRRCVGGRTPPSAT